MEQASAAIYTNVVVAEYAKKTRGVSAELLQKAQASLNLGYQKLLTFEHPLGGFGWFRDEPTTVWLSAFGLHQLHDLAKVYPIDNNVVLRTRKWLMKQRQADGTWCDREFQRNRGQHHRLLLTSYVVWSLLESGVRDERLVPSLAYIRAKIPTVNDAYILAMAANALAAWDSKHNSTLSVLRRLDAMKVRSAHQGAVSFPSQGTSLTYSRDVSLTIETTALTILAMTKSGQFTNTINKATRYLVHHRDVIGTWGSTQATLLSLKALIAVSDGGRVQGETSFVIELNGKAVAKGNVTADNADVMQQFDLSDKMRQTGRNHVTIAINGETNLMYQIVSRHFEPWKQAARAKPILDVAVEYDQTKLSTKDMLTAKATLKYTGEVPTYMVIVDLGIPPGFVVDAGDFAELVAAKRIKKYSVTSRQVTLYLGDVEPGDEQSFTYTLKPKFPIKAKTPPTVAYEYYTPANRATAKPVELEVTE